MKTITIKLPENEAKDLEEFLEKKDFLSKSDFIRYLIAEKLDKNRKEKIGWFMLSEKSASKIWDNEEDEIWNDL